MAHLTSEELSDRIEQLAPMPADEGEVTALVIRPETGTREVVETIHVVPGQGIIGDNYVARGNDRTPDGKAHPEAQICVMNSVVLDVIADGDRDRWQLAGDQILVDFDLSTDNIANGSRLAIGTAVLEVANKLHRGCPKFADRFGADARVFANSDPVQRYRGINVMVVSEGDINVGDKITKLNESGNGSFPPA